MLFRSEQDAIVSTNGERGFFLIEIMVAFFVLLLVLSSVFMIWSQVQYATQSAHMKATALQISQDELEMFFDQFAEPQQKRTLIQAQGYDYQVNWRRMGGWKWKISVQWQSPRQSEERIEWLVWRNVLAMSEVFH